MSGNLELWQTEWCPASHRVRQRMTELALTYTIRQVPVERADRVELAAVTGRDTIPVLVAGGDVIAEERLILDYLDHHFSEAPEAEAQRAKAAKAKRKELEEACPKLATATH